jgi:hypothetical protein
VATLIRLLRDFCSLVVAAFMHGFYWQMDRDKKRREDRQVEVRSYLDV